MISVFEILAELFLNWLLDGCCSRGGHLKCQRSIEMPLASPISEFELCLGRK